MSEKKARIKNYKKVVLLILDGWGLGKQDKSNAIYQAKTPTMDLLYKKYPWTSICAAGKCAGLPSEQVGNSEAGHINLGAGRVVEQDVVKISKQINTGQFFKNSAFMAAISHVRRNNSALHLMGMISNGQSPHSDPDHLLALLTLCRNHQVKKIYLHLFTDGRDSPPRSSLKAVEALERFLQPNEIIATVLGRFYAMDRKKDWTRTNRAYEAMTLGSGHQASSPQEGITRAYNANVTDEFIEPIILYRGHQMVARMKDNDAVIFFNLRSDRARQLSKPFVQKDFEKMNPGAVKRQKFLKNFLFAAMTDFGPDLDSIMTAYPSDDVKDSLPMLLCEKKQLYVAETEKFAHITYFFNGGYANPVAGEKRINIPSPKVDSYAKTPAMSTAKITESIIKNLNNFDFIGANIACPDMVGHTGEMKAGIKAAAAVDKYLKKVVQAVLKNDGVLIVTADHGNLEYMINLETMEVVTEHTTNPVPFILIGRGISPKEKLKRDGVLGNVAPTILWLFGLNKSQLMTKERLI